MALGATSSSLLMCGICDSGGGVPSVIHEFMSTSSARIANR